VGDPDNDLPVIALHFMLSFLVSCLLCLAFRHESGVGRSAKASLGCAFLLVLPGLVCLAAVLLPEEALESLVRLEIPVHFLVIAFYTPAALFVFFRSLPAPQAAFIYGLILAIGELVYFFLVPLRTGSHGMIVSHVWAMNGWLLALVGVSTGLAFLDVAALPRRPGGLAGKPAQTGPEYAPLVWLLAAELGLFVLEGLERGVVLSVDVAPKAVSPLFFLILLTYPVFGYAQASGRFQNKLAALFIPVILAIPLLGVLVEGGTLDPIWLFFAVEVPRQLLLLGIFVTIAHLAKHRRLFPLWLTLAYCMPLTQVSGVLVRGPASAFPYGIAATAFLFSAGTVFCLWRLGRTRAGIPPVRTLWAETADIAVQQPTETTDGKLADFSLFFALTGREEEVLSCLLAGLAPQGIGAKLGIAENTVRHHMTSVMQKTKVRSSRQLRNMFTVWKRDQG
jgi:DNA-binding CsgD family transcriptional regulator